MECILLEVALYSSEPVDDQSAIISVNTFQPHVRPLLLAHL